MNPEYESEEDQKLQEFFEVFSAMSNYDLANEYRAYQKDGSSSLREKSVLKSVINKIKSPQVGLERWITKHEGLTSSEISDLRFRETLNKRGIDPYLGDIDAVRIAITHSYGYENLWKRKKEVEDSDGNKTLKGHTKNLWDMNAEDIRGFAINRYENAESVRKELQKR